MSHRSDAARPVVGRGRWRSRTAALVVIALLAGAGTAFGAISVAEVGVNPVSASSASTDASAVGFSSWSVARSGGTIDGATVGLRHASDHRMRCDVSASLEGSDSTVLARTGDEPLYVPAGTSRDRSLSFDANPSSAFLFDVDATGCRMLGWPMVGFDATRSGTSTGVIPAIATPGAVGANWTFETTGGAPVATAPAVGDGTLVVGSVDDVVYGLDAADGTERWSLATGGDVNATAAVVDGTAYVGSADGSLYALDAADGSEVWTNASVGPIRASPAVANGSVYVGTADGSVTALDATDGSGVWTVASVGRVASSPAVVNGTVYVGSGDGSVYAFATTDGSQLWSTATGDAVASSPAVVNGTVYVGSDDGSVYALDAADGSQLWSTATGDAVASSPAVVNGSVYVGSDDGSVYALDARSGATEWTYDAGGAVRSSPAVANGTVYVGTDAGTVVVLDAADGTKLSARDLDGSIVSGPAVADGTVYAATTAGSVVAMDGDARWWTSFGFDRTNAGHGWGSAPTSTVAEDWNHSTGTAVVSAPAVSEGTVFAGSTGGTVYALAEDDGGLRWSNTDLGPVYSSPAVEDGTVYLGDRSDYVYALDRSDGTERWSVQTGGDVDASPTVDDDTVYVGSDDDSLYALDAANGAQRWTRATGGDVVAAPAVSDETVVAGSADGRLYALDTTGGTDRWTHDAGQPVLEAPAVDDGTVFVPSDANEGPLRSVYPIRTASEWRDGTFDGTAPDGADGSRADRLSMTYANGTAGDGLAGYWRFDGTTGTVPDYSGEGNDGTPTNFEGDERGYPGLFGTTAFEFDGNGDHVTTDRELSTLRSTSSLAFWINTTQNASTGDFRKYPGVTGIEDGSGENDVFWGTLDENGNITLHRGDGNGDPFDGPAINDGNWHHVVLTWNASTGAAEIYVNGTLEASGSTGTGEVTNTFSSLGRVEDTAGSPENFSGRLDEVRVYDHVVSGDTATDLYRHGSGGTFRGNYTHTVDESDAQRWISVNVTGTQLPSSTAVEATAYALDGTGSIVDSETFTVTAGTTTRDLSLSASEDFRLDVNGTTTDPFRSWVVENVTVEHEATGSSATTTVERSIDAASDWDDGTYDQSTADAATAADAGALTMTYPNGTASDDLVGYWRMDRSVSGSGGTTLDYSGDGNDGTVRNGTTTGADGVLGTSAYEFDGSGDFVEQHAVAGDQLPLTVSLWYNWTDDGSPYFSLFSAIDADVNETELRINTDSGTNRYSWQTYSNATDENGLNDTGSPATNEWTHVVATIESASGGDATYTLYENGQQVGQVTDDYTPATNPMHVGAQNESGAERRYFDGAIDEVQVYQRSLSQAEARTLYRTGSDGTYEANYSQTLDTADVGAWETLEVEAPSLPGGTSVDVTVEARDGSGTVVDAETHSLSEGTNAVDLSLTDSDRTRIAINGTSTDPSLSWRIERVSLQRTKQTATAPGCPSCWPVKVDRSGEWKRGTFDGATVDAATAVDADRLAMGYENGTAGDGLAGYWRFDRSSGSVLDYSGAGNDGTATNFDGDERGATGTFGTSAFDFDGTDDYVATDRELSTLRSTSSLSFWIQTTQTSDSTNYWEYPGVTGVEQDGGSEKIYWGAIDPDGRIGVKRSGSGGRAESGPINDGNWHHVALTWDASTGDAQVFVNGTLVDSTSIASGDVSTTFSSIGRIEDTGGTPEHLDGKLDEVRVHDHVLSSAEVTDLYLRGGDGTYEGDYARTVETDATQRWTELSADVSSLPAGTSVDATVEAVYENGTVADSQTVTLGSGVTRQTLSLEDTTAARLFVNGTSTDPTAAWTVENLTLHRELAPPDQATVLDTGHQWDRGDFDGTSPDGATAASAGNLSMRYADGTALDSLVGFYRADRAVAGSGGTVTDYSGADNHGTTDGGLTTGATGTFNSSAHDFDGTDDEVRLGNPADLNVTENLTISVWARSDVTDGTVDAVLAKGDGQYGLRSNANDEWEFYVHDGSSRVAVSSNSALTTGEWTHLVGRYDAATDEVQLWVDGTSQGTATATAIRGTDAAAAVGNDTSVAGRNFDGRIDEVRIYDRSLSTDAVARLHRYGGDGTFEGNYSHVVDTDREHAWEALAVNVTGLPPAASVNATVETVRDDGTVVDAQTIELNAGEDTHALTLSNAEDARLAIDGTTTNATRTWAVENATLVRSARPSTPTVSTTTPTTSSGSTVLDAGAEWDGGSYDMTSSDAASGDRAGALSLRYANGTATDSLRGYWRFDRSVSGSGGTALDYSGDGNDAIVRNGTTTGADGVFGTSAYDFDGSDGYVEQHATSGDQLPVTVSLWYNWTGGGDEFQAFFGATESNQTIFRLHNTDSYNSYIWQTYSSEHGTAGIPGTGSVEVDDWTHVVVRAEPVDGSDDVRYSFFEDGRLLNETTDRWTPAPTDLYVGAQNATKDSEHFAGRIDEVRAYDRALSDAEVERLYRQGGDGTFRGNYTKTVDEDEPQEWHRLFANVTGKPPETGLEATVEVRKDDGTVVDAQTIELSAGEHTYDLALSNATDARLAINGTSTDATRTWEVENATLTYDPVSTSGPTVLDATSEWNGGSYDMTSADGANGTQAGALSMRYPNGTAGDDLQGFYRLDDDVSGSGGTVTDYSGNGIDGTTEGDVVTGSTGTFDGSAMTLDGTDDYVDLGNPSQLDVAGDLTVSAWVNLARVDSTFQPVVTKGDTQYVLQNGNGGEWAFVVNGGGTWYPAVDSEQATEDAWVHLTGTFDASAGESALWVNGTRVDTNASAAMDSNSQPVRIGNNSEQTDRYFNGTVDEVRIYDRTLSAGEIDSLYRQGGDGTFRGNYTKTVDNDEAHEWQRLIANVTGKPPGTGLEATVEVRKDDGTVVDSQTITLSAGEHTHDLALANASDARLAINGTSTDVTRTWAVENVTLTSDPVTTSGTTGPTPGDAELVAVDAETGIATWSRDLRYDVTTSPAVDDDAVYVGLYNGTVVALDRQNGSTLWVHAADGATVAGSPAVVGDTVYVGANSSRLYGLATSDGSERFALDVSGPVRSAPAPLNDTVYVGADDGGIRAAR